MEVAEIIVVLLPLRRLKDCALGGDSGAGSSEARARAYREGTNLLP
jgi:hypothetical protein